MGRRYPCRASKSRGWGRTQTMPSRTPVSLDSTERSSTARSTTRSPGTAPSRSTGCRSTAWRAHRAIGMGSDQLVPALAGQEWADEHGEAAARDTEGALFGE